MQINGIAGRLAVLSLGLVSIIGSIGAIIITATGHDIPSGYWSVPSTALGALAAFLVPGPRGETPHGN